MQKKRTFCKQSRLYHSITDLLRIGASADHTKTWFENLSVERYLPAQYAEVKDDIPVSAEMKTSTQQIVLLYARGHHAMCRQ
jgi:hypothetical protein